MTIEQAIYQIIHASDQERVRVFEINKQSLKYTGSELGEPNKPFSITPFKIGSANLHLLSNLY